MHGITFDTEQTHMTLLKVILFYVSGECFSVLAEIYVVKPFTLDIVSTIDGIMVLLTHFLSVISFAFAIIVAYPKVYKTLSAAYNKLKTKFKNKKP